MPQQRSHTSPVPKRSALYAASHWSVACSKAVRVKNIRAAAENFWRARRRRSTCSNTSEVRVADNVFRSRAVCWGSGRLSSASSVRTAAASRPVSHS